MDNDDHYWYFQKWKILTKLLRNVALSEIEELLKFCTPMTKTEQSKIAERYVKSVMTALERRAQENAQEKSGFGGPWAFGLRLFDQPDRLILLLENDRSTICNPKDKGITRDQAVATKFADYLRHARHRAISPKPNRGRVWLEIAKIDRELPLVTDPLDADHLDEVLLCIRREIRDSNNKNLPRKRDTLEGYYREFDQRCQDLTFDDQETSLDEASTSLSGLQALLQLTVMQFDMRLDLLRMPPELRSVLNHWIETGMDVADEVGKRHQRSGTETKEDFCRREGITIREYDDRLDRAKAFLRDALEDLL